MSTEARELRQALLAALPASTSLRGHPPRPEHVYLPPSHLKALRLEHPLVIGGRGVGKSFWSAALVSEEVRGLLSSSLPELSRTLVRPGYGERPRLENYPDMETFAELLAGPGAFEPYQVWRALLARSISSVLVDAPPGEAPPSASWRESARWAAEHPEKLARLLERAESGLEAVQRNLLLVFDALDRSSRDWPTMDRIVRDLLRVALALEPFDHLHAKVFLREDQYHGRGVTDFPDASKLTASRVELSWSLEDLHGLLWQYLLNAPGEHGRRMRELYREVVGRSPSQVAGAGWRPDAIRRDREAQRRLFTRLAGPWMGRDRRRGNTYTWIVNHLSDTRRFASPRSFLAALRAAAEDSEERHPDHPHALHYESIKRGVQKASELRVEELAEDYPWIRALLSPLRGLLVPCTQAEVAERWSDALGTRPPSKLASSRLPPEHWEDGWEGVFEDLCALGIFERVAGGRVNVPDLYRVGLGIGRKGGVPPRRGGLS